MVRKVKKGCHAMTNTTQMGWLDARNPHVRFDEWEVASAKPRRGSLLNKKITLMLLGFFLAPWNGVLADTQTINGVPWTYSITNGEASIGIFVPLDPLLPYGPAAEFSYAVPIATSGDLDIPFALGGCPVTRIERHAFVRHERLSRVTIPPSVRSVGLQSFEQCKGLVGVTIPSSVTNIENQAFAFCTNLTSVTIPVNVKNLGQWTFLCCGSLARVIIKEGLVRVDAETFTGCDGLETFIVEDGNPNYKAVNGMLLSKDGLKLAHGVNGDVVIPPTVTDIGDYAFNWYTKLKSVKIPSSVQRIGKYSFEGCYDLASVVIPSSVTDVGDYAFSSCRDLSSVTISDGVKNIGEAAFSWCGKLPIIILPSSVSALGKDPDGDYGEWWTRDGAGRRHYFTDKCSAALVFNGKPPRAYGKGVYTYSRGYFYRKNIDDWNAEIVNGKWHGVEMHCLDIEPRGCDWNAGTINLGWYGIATNLNKVTYKVYWSESDDPESCVDMPDHLVGTRVFTPSEFGVHELTISDDQYLARGDGLSPIYYHVVGTDGSKSFCKTREVVVDRIGGFLFEYARTRYGLALRSVSVDESAAVTSGEVVIPETIDDCDVVEIAGAAFAGNAEITGVTIPTSVTSIGEGAFSNCNNLKTVYVSYGDLERIRALMKDASLDCDDVLFVEEPAPDGSDYTEEVDGYSWTFSVINGEAKIEYLTPEPVGTLTIPETLGGRPVTGIGDDAFCYCRGLTSVTIPQGVTNVGEAAFQGCDGLTSVTIPENVTCVGAYAFEYCTNLTSVTILSREVSIGENAFGDCSGLTNVTILSDAASIGDGAFVACSNLTSVTIPQGVTNIGSYAFLYCGTLECVTIPSSVGCVGEGAFYGCYSLTNVTISEGVSGIGVEAFSWCTNLTTVTIPSSVTNIGAYAFLGCDELEAVCFDGAPPEGLADAWINQDAAIRYNVDYEDEWLPVIESCGFTNAAANGHEPGESLPDGGPYTNEVNGVEWTFFVENGEAVIRSDAEYKSAIPSSTEGTLEVPSRLGGHPVVEIGEKAFYRCDSLVEVTIPEGVRRIGNMAFYMCYGLASVELPMSVTEFGEWCLHSCYMLDNVVVPEGVDELPQGMFYECVSLQHVELPSTLQKIGAWSFAYCDTLSGVDIPEAVTNIRGRAFYYCTNITEFVLSKNVEVIWREAFVGCSNVERYDVDEDNVCFSSFEGALYSKDCSELLYYPSGRKGEARLATDVKRICDDAFLDAGGITKLAIPYGVTNVGRYAFCGCSAIEALFIPESVTAISGEGLFARCSSLRDVVLPSSFNEVARALFYNCVSLTNMTFMGDAPSILTEDLVFDNVPKSATVTVEDGRMGWDDDHDGLWNGFRLVISACALPSVPGDATAEEVRVATDRFADPKLSENITNEAEYSAFREWSGTVKQQGGTAAGAAGVMAAANAWVSFALGQDALLEMPPTDEDLEIEAFVPAAESGKFDFTVSVKDVEVSSEAAAANLKKVFGLEGGSSLQGMSSENVDIVFGTPEDGKVKFTAGPNAANADATTFFMKVRVK